MAANEELNQLSTTDASNTPAGSDVIGATLDNELRSIKANIARSAREESTATASAAATLALTVLNKIVPVSGSAGGSTTITLPAAATAGAGFRFTAWKTDSANNVIIQPDGAETVNGAANYTLATQYEAAQFVTDGTSWVVESTAKRELGNADIADGSITTAKLAASAVTADKLGTDSVTAAKIQASAVGESELASDSVSAAKIQADAVGASEIASGAVGTSELSNDSATNAKLANMAQDTIKGRSTAGTGDPEDLTVSQVRTMLSVYDQSTSDSRYVNVSGDTMTGDLSFGDSDKALFGADSDLQIYHDGSNSYVKDAGIGYLILGGQSTGTAIHNGSGQNLLITGASDINLAYAGSNKLATTSAGVNVTGTLDATGIIDTASGFQFGSNNNYLYQSGTDEVTLRVGSRPTYFDFHDLGASTGVRFNSTSTPLYLGAGQNNHVKISAAETVINAGSAAMNFRVESAPSAYALFVDATNSRVGINNNSPTESLDVTGNARLVSEDDASAAEPVLTLYRNSATPADGDYLGQIKFQGESDSGATRVYAKITAKTSDVTNLSEDGLIETSIRKAGANTIVARQTHDCLKLINGTGLEVAGDAKITGGIGDSSGGLGSSGQVLSSTGTGTNWIDTASNAQVMTFSGDSSVIITPNVVDGIYRITGYLYNSVDASVILQTSDDAGVNFIDTAGDVAFTYIRHDYATTANTVSSGSNITSPGFYLDTHPSSTENEFNTFQAVLAFNGVGRISLYSAGTEFTTGANMSVYSIASTSTGNHDSGINRIKILPSTGTLTGTVIIENLPLS